MKKWQHTPGPWHHNSDPDPQHIFSANNMLIAMVAIGCGRKNANIIAAAPEMLDALLLVANSGPLNNGLRDENTMRIVHEAIAKATGHSPAPVEEFQQLEEDKLKGRSE